jgi:hypothetical protein
MEGSLAFLRMESLHILMKDRRRQRTLQSVREIDSVYLMQSIVSNARCRHYILNIVTHCYTKQESDIIKNILLLFGC